MVRSGVAGRPPPPPYAALNGALVRPLPSQLTGLSVTCKFCLTGDRKSRQHQEPTLTSEERLLAVLTAVANPHRMRVIAELRGGRVHVSELARRLEMSRPLLYMHLDKLEKAGLVNGQLELSQDGKAMKYFELAPFELRLTAETITQALRDGDQEAGPGHNDHTEESNR
jgi:DNA-binding transcriptional ArsR family regulator